MARLTTILKQLKAEKVDTMSILDKIDKSLLRGTIHESTYNALKEKYDSRLIQIEHDIFETETEIEARKRARAKKRAKQERENKANKEEEPRNIVTLNKLKVSRVNIQKTVNVPEEGPAMSLEDAILDLVTETSQMSKKLTAQEILNELRMNTQDHFTKLEVIKCLHALVNEGKIKRVEDPNRDLRYFLDVSWNVDSLLAIQR